MNAVIKATVKLAGIESLEVQGRDTLDFHEVSVTTIRQMLELAYRSGYSAGIVDGRDA